MAGAEIYVDDVMMMVKMVKMVKKKSEDERVEGGEWIGRGEREDEGEVTRRNDATGRTDEGHRGH